jgi:plastocyanin
VSVLKFKRKTAFRIYGNYYKSKKQIHCTNFSWRVIMRRGFVIFVVLFSIFLAIGCTGSNKGQTATPAETPAVTPVNTSGVASVNPSAATAVTPQPTANGKIVEVSIQGFAFNPESAGITPGDTVRWTNMDSAAHIVKGDSFESGSLAKGDTYEYVFTKPGVYNYICSVHPSMKGTISVVQNK